MASQETHEKLPVRELHPRSVLDVLLGDAARQGEEPPPAVNRARRWQRNYGLIIAVVDTAMLALAALIGYVTKYGIAANRSAPDTRYLTLALFGVGGWLICLLLSRAYEDRFLGVGPQEIQRVFNASVRFAAAAALLAYGLRVHVLRGFIINSLVAGTVLLAIGRYAGHVVIRRLRRRGKLCSRALVLGDRDHVAHLVRQTHRERDAGLTVVGACTPLGNRDRMVPGVNVPIVGSLTSVVKAVKEVDADTVAVTASPGITPDTLRRLAWQLEGTGVDLLVSPGLTDVAGPRINIRPVGSRLPLLHVEEPEFTGVRRLLKGLQDRLLALLAVLLLSPVLLAVALAVRLESRGPALFRQTRVGRCSEPFTVYKFRSMYTDAEARLAGLQHLNESDASGVLFKMKDDPRITRVGKFIRRYSLDELPQLLNVLIGNMAVVGPRPPLPREVDLYGHVVRRRLLVKPGITGLWQVSGRSDLSWEDSVRLDLYYVENWSLALDLQIILKTILAVARGSGAY